MISLNLWTSLVVFCRGMTSQFDEEVTVIDWDAHTQIQELPAGNLIGPMALTFDETSTQMFDVAFSIGLSTQQDANLFRLREMVAKTFEELRPMKTLTYYDDATKRPVSWLKIQDGTSVAPISRTELRGLQFIQVNALLDPMVG